MSGRRREGSVSEEAAERIQRQLAASDLWRRVVARELEALEARRVPVPDELAARIKRHLSGDDPRAP